MKEPFSSCPARVTQSVQGRDKGGFFLILENEGDGVKIADGQRHKLANPEERRPCI